MKINIVIDEKRMQKIGHNLMLGFLLCLSIYVFVSGLFAIIIVALLNEFNLGCDDSDLDGWNRSALSIRTDYKTGLQYLESKEGFLTPRLDERGDQTRIKVMHNDK